MIKKVLPGIVIRLALIVVGLVFGSDVFAAGSQLTLSTISSNLSTGIGSVVNIMQDIATVAGIGFIFSSFFKFHQHKMNPTQVPLSQGVTMLLIGAGLTVFPHLLDVASKGVFGQSIAKVGGTEFSTAISGG